MKDNKEPNKIDWFKVIPIGLALLYAVGFVVWNSYLLLFGVFEYNFLQTRFLSAGIAATFVIGIGGSAIFLLIDLINRVASKVFKFQRSWIRRYPRIVVFCLVAFLTMLSYFYVLFIFPWIPQVFGGAQPSVASLLADADDIEYLNNFNIHSAPNADMKKSVQTLPICILYQSDRYILLGVQYVQDGKRNIRNLLMKMDRIEGLQYGLGDDLRCKSWDFYVGLKLHRGNKLYGSGPSDQAEYICK